MRILYIDVDSLRPDHLGCYGYHRDTSPTIDALAARGIRFDGVYASDVPCLPSRTALISGRLGIRNGVVNHGGARAVPYPEGASRGFRSRLAETSWAALLRSAGMRTVTISTFPFRHDAYHWCTGFSEVYDLGTFGLETADRVARLARKWIERDGHRDSWFLHVNLWDPHTPYRTPEEYGEPFRDDPLPDWLTEDVRAEHWTRPGPHSAQEVNGYTPDGPYGDLFERQPRRIEDREAVRRLFDGYDTGVRYADDHVGRILDALDGVGVGDETAVLVSADHGENLGELGIYGDHHTADEITCRVPAVLSWPGIDGGRVDTRLHYQVDVAATILELCGVDVPEAWDGRSFATALRDGTDDGRDHLVCSQGAWAAQRSVRFGDHLYLQTHHDAYHGLDDELLFDVAADPHERRDLSADEPELAGRGRKLLDAWREEMLSSSPHPDPMDEVLAEGGPFHVRGELAAYLPRLRETGRGAWTDHLAERYPQELAEG